MLTIFALIALAIFQPPTRDDPLAREAAVVFCIAAKHFENQNPKVAIYALNEMTTTYRHTPIGRFLRAGMAP